MICKCCQQDLPETKFERYKTGTYRGVCHHCWWELYGRRMRQRWWLKKVEAEQRQKYS